MVTCKGQQITRFTESDNIAKHASIDLLLALLLAIATTGALAPSIIGGGGGVKGGSTWRLNSRLSRPFETKIFPYVGQKKCQISAAIEIYFVR